MTELKLFETASIRSYYDTKTDKWYFSIVDVVEMLTNSINLTDYLKKLRKRDTELGSFLGTNCPQIAMVNKSGIKRKTLAGTRIRIIANNFITNNKNMLRRVFMIIA